MSEAEFDSCGAIAPFMGFMGVAASMIFANVGAAHGTANAGRSIMWSGIKSPDLLWRNLIPVVMAGVNGIYGLITAIIILGAIGKPDGDGYYTYSFYTGAAHLAAGLCCGLSALGSGMAIGIAGDAAVSACGTWDFESKKRSKQRHQRGGRSSKKNKSNGGDQLFVSMVLIQVFAGNVALYGLIASILLSQQIFYCGAQ